MNDPIDLIDRTGEGPVAATVAALTVAGFCAGTSVGSTFNLFADFLRGAEDRSLIDQTLARINERLCRGDLTPEQQAHLEQSRARLVVAGNDPILRFASQNARMSADELAGSIICEMAAGGIYLLTIAPSS